MQTKYSVLGYRIDLYFHGYKLAIEIDEFGHSERDSDDERKEEIEKERNCKFIRINPDEENVNEKIVVNEIRRHIKKSSKKSLIENLLKRLLESEFKSKHSIKSKYLKYVVKKYCHHYKTCKVIV